MEYIIATKKRNPSPRGPRNFAERSESSYGSWDDTKFFSVALKPDRQAGPIYIVAK